MRKICFKPTTEREREERRRRKMLEWPLRSGLMVQLDLVGLEFLEISYWERASREESDACPPDFYSHFRDFLLNEFSCEISSLHTWPFGLDTLIARRRLTSRRKKKNWKSSRLLSLVRFVIHILAVFSTSSKQHNRREGPVEERMERCRRRQAPDFMRIYG